MTHSATLAISAREYHPWDRARIVIDTANTSVDKTLSALRSMIRQYSSPDLPFAGV